MHACTGIHTCMHGWMDGCMCIHPLGAYANIKHGFANIFSAQTSLPSSHDEPPSPWFWQTSEEMFSERQRSGFCFQHLSGARTNFSSFFFLFERLQTGWNQWTCGWKSHYKALWGRDVVMITLQCYLCRAHVVMMAELKDAVLDPSRHDVINHTHPLDVRRNNLTFRV